MQYNNMNTNNTNTNNANNQEVSTMENNMNNTINTINTNNAQEVTIMENNVNNQEVNNMKTFVKLINATYTTNVTLWFEQGHIGKAFAEYFEDVFEDSICSNIIVRCGTDYMPHMAIREVKGTNEHLTMVDDEVGYVYEHGFDIMIDDMMRIAQLLNGFLAGTEYRAYAGTYARYNAENADRYLNYSIAPHNKCTIEIGNTALCLSTRITLVGNDEHIEVYGDDAEFVDLYSHELIVKLQEAFEAADSDITVDYVDTTPYGMLIDFTRAEPITIVNMDNAEMHEVYIANAADTDKIVTALSAICTNTQFTIVAGTAEECFNLLNRSDTVTPVEKPTTEPKINKVLTLDDFMKECISCGGNWTAMMLSGIERVAPDVFEALPDVTYTFEEVCFIVNHLCVDRPHLRAVHSIDSKNGVLYRTNEGKFVFRPITDEEADMNTKTLFEHLNGVLFEEE